MVLEMVWFVGVFVLLGGFNNNRGNKVVSIGVSPLLFVVRDEGWLRFLECALFV